jgi:quercetin dioxygenase-like cupin family protein
MTRLFESLAPRGQGRRRIALLLLIGAVFVAAAFGTARAWATTGNGAVSNYVARGVLTHSVVIGVPGTTKVTRTVTVRVNKKKVVRKRVTFTVPSVTPLMTCSEAKACDLAIQQLTIAPGGHTGWHNHPGPTFVSVAQGEGTLYHDMAACPSTKYGVNAGFLQPETEIHNMRNEGSTPLILWAFYALPPGTANTAIRIDRPQPAACPNIP